MKRETMAGVLLLLFWVLVAALLVSAVNPHVWNSLFGRWAPVPVSHIVADAASYRIELARRAANRAAQASQRETARVMSRLDRMSRAGLDVSRQRSRASCHSSRRAQLAAQRAYQRTIGKQGDQSDDRQFGKDSRAGSRSVH